MENSDEALARLLQEEEDAIALSQGRALPSSLLGKRPREASTPSASSSSTQSGRGRHDPSSHNSLDPHPHHSRRRCDETLLQPLGSDTKSSSASAVSASSSSTSTVSSSSSSSPSSSHKEIKTSGTQQVLYGELGFFVTRIPAFGDINTVPNRFTTRFEELFAGPEPPQEIIFFNYMLDPDWLIKALPRFEEVKKVCFTCIIRLL